MHTAAFVVGPKQNFRKAPVKLQPNIFAGYAVIRRFFVTPRVVFLGQTIH